VEPSPFTVLGVAGSLRRGSVNRALLAAATHELPPGAVLRTWDGLAAVPAFDEDRETDPVPAPVAALRAAIAGAGALLIATPEYNGSLPGALKNALDWASRPYGASVLEGRAVAVVGAGPGPTGAADAQADLVRVLGRAGARVLGGPLPVPSALRAFDERGRLRDPELRAALAAVLAGLGERAGSAA
jgi:chromate reductase, NAD(P)H dehydrogenase (quinone)